jgi:hypothetical protein
MKIGHIRVYRKTLTHARGHYARGLGVEPDCGSIGAQVAMYV